MFATAAGHVAEHVQGGLHRLYFFTAHERVSFLNDHKCRRRIVARSLPRKTLTYEIRRYQVFHDIVGDADVDHVNAAWPEHGRQIEAAQGRLVEDTCVNQELQLAAKAHVVD